MKVRLINTEQVQGLFKEWGLFATECYATPEEYAEKVGKGCFISEHYSGSRTEYIKFKISGVDRGVAEQAMRHEIGTRNHVLDEHSYDENPCNIIKNMQSFRYVAKDNFDYTTPKNIKKHQDAMDAYVMTMDFINAQRKWIQATLIEHGVPEREAVEDANYVLPRATNTSLTIGFTPEALIHYMHKRLCTCSQDFHRELARLMKAEVQKVAPELSEKLVPHCDYLLWCPETKKRSCGKHPVRQELIEQIRSAE
jgi:thymidylate synthase ThyX